VAQGIGTQSRGHGFTGSTKSCQCRPASAAFMTADFQADGRRASNLSAVGSRPTWGALRLRQLA
jgi:hypothetical protein